MIFTIRSTNDTKTIDVPFQFPGSLFDIMSRNNEDNIIALPYPDMDLEILDKYFDFWRARNRMSYFAARRAFSDIMVNGLDVEMFLYNIDYLGLPIYPFRLALVQTNYRFRFRHDRNYDSKYVTICLDDSRVFYDNLAINGRHTIYRAPKPEDPLVAIKVHPNNRYHDLLQYAVVHPMSLRINREKLVDCSYSYHGDIYMFYNNTQRWKRAESKFVTLAGPIAEVPVFTERSPTYTLYRNVYVIYYGDGFDEVCTFFATKPQVRYISSGDSYTEVAPNISARRLSNRDAMGYTRERNQIVTPFMNVDESTPHSLHIITGDLPEGEIIWGIEDWFRSRLLPPPGSGADTPVYPQASAP